MSSTDFPPPLGHGGPGHPGEAAADPPARVARTLREPETLARGQSIGRFVVQRLLGRGAMGEVYAGWDQALARTVAVKVVRAEQTSDSAEGRARLMREAQAIARVSHPNVVVVYETGMFQDRVFIAMEYVEGTTLGYWNNVCVRNWPEVLEVVLAAGRGLSAAHERNLVHRDFKPENVMIAADGQVRVMDFGLVQMTPARAGKDDQAVVGIDGGGEAAWPAARDATSGPVGGDGWGPRAVITGGSGARNRVSDGAGGAGAAIGNDPFLDPLLSTRVIGGGRAGGDLVGASSSAGDLAASPAIGTEDGATSTLGLTQTGAMLGTPAYMSPEQFAGRPTDARTDQFSFCIALYEALYGERPFTGGNFGDLALRVLEGTVRPEPAGSKVPAFIRAALLRGLSVDPAARWPSMAALLAALEQGAAAVASRRRFAAAAATKLADVWEAPRRDLEVETAMKAEMRRAFLATGKRYAAQAFATTAQILDRYARRWTDLYVEACEATHVRGDQSAEVLDLRMACLRDALEDLKAFCAELSRASPEAVERSVAAANALPSLDRCENVELLRAMVRPPDDPATAEAVLRLRSRLARGRAAARLGRLNDALEVLEGVRTMARDVRYAPLLADALLALGVLQAERSSFEESRAALYEAVWVGMASRHDEAAAEAATYLVYVVGAAQAQFVPAEIWSHMAETLIRRIGGRDLLLGWLLNNRAAMREAEGRLPEALADARAALAAKERVLQPNDPDIGVSIGNVAVLLDGLGRTEEAAEHAARAVKVADEGLGPEHPGTALPLSNHAEILLHAGRFDEAIPLARRALSIFERETEPDGLYVTYPLIIIGRAELARGHAAAALPSLERAYTIRCARDAVPSRRGEAAFALARALGLGGAAGEANRARARELAAEARVEYQRAPSTPAVARELAIVEAWLK